MKIVVLGAGVIGVTTAYYLAREGHAVTVIDRQTGVARETSFANAGLIAPGHVYAWASPRAPMILLKSLVQEDTALKLRLRVDPRMWAWGMRFLANCTRERNRRNTLRKLSLCLYSRAELIALRDETGIAYDGIAKGALYLYRDPTHFADGVANMRLLNENGLALEALDPEGCVRLEPQLTAAKPRLAGGIHSSIDESGDAHLFTEALARLCAPLGVEFRLGETIRRIEAEGDRVGGVVTGRGTVSGDMYVLALGCDSPILGRGIGLDLPVYPVKGYSLTVPAGQGAPTVGGVDEGYLVAFARMGDRLRLTGTADFAGYDTAHRPADFATILRCARDLFPAGGDYERPSHWACLRPMTPDGPPILGACRYRNLYLNTGHGHMGWTMACGSSRTVADLILGRKPALDLDGLTIDRY
jgi:D-amino-acid dehydrogenase